MRITIFRVQAALALALILACQLTLGQDSAWDQQRWSAEQSNPGGLFQLTSFNYYEANANTYYADTNDGQGGGGTPTPAAESSAGGGNNCESCFGNNGCAICQDCPQRGAILFTGFDSWRGRPDGSFQNNDGISSGFNYATRLGRLSDMTGIGFQAGASYGLYDFNGRQSSAPNNTTQQQTFITVGFFKKSNENSAWSYGLVHDWMINRAYSVFAVNPTFGQWRGQIAYATSDWNEFGAWGTLRDRGQTSRSGNTNVAFRPIDQVNFFWHHKYACLADSWIWLGFPQNNRLNAPGNLGDWTFGGSFQAPLNDYISLYSNWQYMHPSAAAGPAAGRDNAWYISFGLAYYIGGHARTSTVAGNCWLPLMPVANNGNFLVDSSSTL